MRFYGEWHYLKYLEQHVLPGHIRQLGTVPPFESEHWASARIVLHRLILGYCMIEASFIVRWSGEVAVQVVTVMELQVKEDHRL